MPAEEHLNSEWQYFVSCVPILVLFTTFPCVVSGTVPCKSCYRGEKKVKFYVGKDKSHISADSIA